mmetsp:Transcript_57782/g.111454  ORF Transcript_57782/g.111454 Transcript_57782/m.111454 type:complete len:232 (-) Transcript_57782:48-743(-)
MADESPAELLRVLWVARPEAPRRNRKSSSSSELSPSLSPVACSTSSSPPLSTPSDSSSSSSSASCSSASVSASPAATTSEQVAPSGNSRWEPRGEEAPLSEKAAAACCGGPLTNPLLPLFPADLEAACPKVTGLFVSVPRWYGCSPAGLSNRPARSAAVSASAQWLLKMLRPVTPDSAGSSGPSESEKSSCGSMERTDFVSSAPLCWHISGFCSCCCKHCRAGRCDGSGRS